MKTLSSSLELVSIDAAPAELKALPPLRKARAMALFASLAPDFSGRYYACSPPTPSLDQAIEDLLRSGLIELGAEGSDLAIRVVPSKLAKTGDPKEGA